MGKKIYITIIILLAISVGIIIRNTMKMESVIIKPIDNEFNLKLEFGVQYYTISGYSKRSVEELTSDVENYLISNKSSVKNAKMILLYEDSFFNNYKKNLRESARDNEFGGIEGYQDNLVVKVWYDESNNQSEKHFIIYKDGKVIFDKVK